MAVRKQEISGNRATLTMAERADRHELYEASVQNVEEECEFVTDRFREIRGRDALSFREDFCGTASAACQWVRQGSAHSAIGIDIDPAVLEWGRKHRLNRLTDEQRDRLTLIESDVMTVTTERVDVVGAFNFSYFLFKKRAAMLNYFKLGL